MRFHKIKSVTELKKLAKDGIDCSIILNYGLKSSKHITWDNKTNRFYIINYIDDTEQKLTPAQIVDDKITNIGKAMRYSALVMEV